MKNIILFFTLLACSSLPQKSIRSKLSADGYNIVIGCSIYDLYGKLLKTFSGDNCLFNEDGDLLTYDNSKSELSLLDKNSNSKWSIKGHFHHQMRKSDTGGFLVNASVFKSFGVDKKVRFDEIQLISKSGKISFRFSFYDYLMKLPWTKSMKSYDAKWDKKLGSIKEFTQLVSSYEIPFDIVQDGNVLFPKGSIVAINNRSSQGVMIIDPKLKEVLGSIRVTHFERIHDAHFISPTEILFYKNSTYFHPVSQAERASVRIYNLDKRLITHEINPDLFNFKNGNAQLVNDSILFISDSNVAGSVTDLTFKDLKLIDSDTINKIQTSLNSRVIFYDRTTGEMEETIFDFNIEAARLEKVDIFL